jgi:uncharacterized protein YutE (UPF0331/DUF86 family)
MTPSEISQKVVTGKIELVQRFVSQIEDIDLEPVEAFISSPLNVAAGESNLRRSLEALLDLGRHVLARGFGVPAVEYGEIGPKMTTCGVLDRERGETLRKIGGYRNRLVHLYHEVTPEELHQILTTELQDVVDITESIKSWLAANPDRVNNDL